MMNRDALRGLAATVVLLTALGASSTAHAASEQDRRTARQELTQAQDLKKQGQLQESLSHYEESQRLDPKLTTLMELADCEEQLGRLLEAQSHFIAARDQAKHDELPQSRARAEQRATAVEKRLAHLTLQLAGDTPANAQVFRDDTLLEPASLGTPLVANPGEHVVVVKAPEHTDAKYNVKLAEGDSQTLPIAVGPSNAPPPAPPPPPPKVAPAPKPTNQATAELSTSSGSTRRTLGIVAGSVGIVGLGAGSILWYVGYRDGNSIGPTADQNLLLGQISVIAGGALLVTGIVLFATAPSGDAPKTARFKLTPTLSVGQNATVLGAAGQF
jgi:hypothetical protein